MSLKIAVLGAGPGGYVAAIRASQLGARVTVIEKESPGGTCLNYGCIPSKVIRKTAQMIEGMKKADTYGISGCIEPAADMKALMVRKNGILETQRKGILGLLSKNNVEYVKGRGVIRDRGVIDVTSDGSEKVEVHYDRLIIATGTVPLNIPDFAFDSEYILSSNDLLELESIPESIVIVGGGVIGCEFAFMLSSLGASVTVVEAMDRILPLPSVDESCSKILQREMKKRKIKFYTQRAVSSVKISEGGVAVTVGKSPFDDTAEVREVQVRAAKMAVCIGRSPNSSGIGLENTGVTTDERGWIKTDDYLETEASGIYAIGDITGPGRVMLAHVASAEGLIAAENIMGSEKKMDYRVIPGGIFTMPEIGNVGLSESEALKRGYPAKSENVLFRTIGKAQVEGEIAGEARIVFDDQTEKILGVHITGPHATDLIAEGALAIKMGATLSDLADTIHSHPTLSEIMLETAFKSLGKSLHG